MEISKWLKKFERTSWEPQIIISGGILFTLFQTQGALIQLANYFAPLDSELLNPVLGFFGVGISALTVGFSLHLITKAFWIALLALKSVFPDGINISKLNYSESFFNKIVIDTSLESKITKIGNASNLMFVVSFLFLLMFFGLGMYATLIAVLLLFFPLIVPMEIVLFAPLALPFVDFITFGILKKGKISSKFYHPYYKLISTMTLSFLYREILYTIISNIPKRKIASFTFLISIPIVILSFYNVAPITSRSTVFSTWSYLQNITASQAITNRNYENLRNPDDRISSGTIQSDIIGGKHVKLYLKYRSWWDEELNDLANNNKTLSYSQIANMYLDVKIDNFNVSNVTWYYTRREDINQFGIIGFVPIPDLAYGPHVIDVTSTKGGPLRFTAAFWKE